MEGKALDFDIGHKIKALRHRHKLRLKDLAVKIDCSESLLSKVENGKVQPSLKILHRLTTSLGTTIGALFADAQEDDITIFRADNRPVVMTRADEAGGMIGIERMTPFSEDQLLEANIHVIDPETDSGGEITHAGEEVGYILVGSLELRIANKVFSLTEGDSFYFRSELPHSYRNPGRVTTRVLWVNTPPTF